MSMTIKYLLASVVVVGAFAVAHAQTTTPDGDYLPRNYDSGYQGPGGYAPAPSGNYGGGNGNYGGGYGPGPYGNSGQYGYAPHYNYNHNYNYHNGGYGNGYDGGYSNGYDGGSGYGRY
jgi:hypothetical protein